MLRGLKEGGLIRSVRSSDDARHLHLSLTAAGRRAFAPLDRHSAGRRRRAARAARRPASSSELLAAMRDDRARCSRERAAPAAPWLLRPPRSGDIGWVVAPPRRPLRPASTAGTCASRRWSRASRADFVEHFDRAREACWIAERDGADVGCVFLVQARDEASGSGRRRHGAAAHAAGRAGGARPGHRRPPGRRMRALRPRARLSADRPLDQQRPRRRAPSTQRAGYVLSSSEPHDSFGHELVGETWELALA